MMEEHEYMNDLRMEEFRHLPYPIQEVRAWRLAVQDRTEGMTCEQNEAYYKELRKKTDAFCAEHGIKIKYAEPAAAVSR